MRIYCLALTVALTVIGICPGSLAQENPAPAIPETKVDVQGCAELKDVPRLPASVLVSCDKSDSSEVAMPLQPDAQGYASDKSVRGAYEFREYQLALAEHQEQAFANMLQLLPMAGFNVRFSSAPSTITGHKDGVWVLISLSGEYCDVKVVRVKEELWTPPFKNAEEISREVDVDGRAGIYGIEFSPDNTAINERDPKTLIEVLKYLGGRPNVPIIVESHKFSIGGSPEDDLEITRKRTKVVIDWLQAHGIPAGRLQPRALGRIKPVTDNDTPLGIRRNERIELTTAH